VKYTKFRIKNFKGIKDTTIDLQSIAGASVFAFVGLNESGKTTILEAIHSFAPDTATSELVGGDEESGVPYNERVPRHQLSSFTGDVSVSATLDVDKTDISRILKALLDGRGLTVDEPTFPTEVIFERKQHFENGDYQENYFTLLTQPKVRTKGQRKWREPTQEEAEYIRDEVYWHTPDIAYFPTFVFDFPEKIYLTERGNELDRFYRGSFQDILDYDGKGYTIDKDIVRRVRSETMTVSWLRFLALWSNHDERKKIDHVMDRASATVTKVVFGRWNKIFGEDAKGKEIVITFDPMKGEKKDQNGNLIETNQHDVCIKFTIKDGTRRFAVNDRSLGFRWFFAFMLFTQFRVARAGSRPLLFLFDEPASNLHSAAQQKLIECFPEIAKGQNALAYTTHSHYMIEPKWLEQTFIVTNRADTPTESILDAVSLDDESLDIKATLYRAFVNDHPSQTSYFQPILDRLQVVPSRFDIWAASVVLEGRSDYYILRYALKLLRTKDLALLPGMGATTFGALAAMHVGWNLNFLFILDSDVQGLEQKKRYVAEYGIPQNRIMSLGEAVSGLKQIEDLLDDEARATVRQELGISAEPTKAQIKRFFQERLASEQVKSLGLGFAASAKELLEAMSDRLNAKA